MTFSNVRSRPPLSPRGSLGGVCGRYASSRNPDDLVTEFDVEAIFVREQLAPDYNVAPTKDVYAIVARPPREDPTAPPQRRLTVMRWGLVPSWALHPSIGTQLINARVETVHEKPAFRRAFVARRCLLPADGYYEWFGAQRGNKQPFFIRPRDGGVLAMAGLYEVWRDPAKRPEDPDGLLWSCAVLTTAAEDSLGHLHDRMPLVVERGRYGPWLDPTITNATTLRTLLTPAAPGRLDAYPVRPLVSDVRNNGPELIAPLSPDQQEPATLF
jgi:putative SOS response-associated peptidase YedK